MPLVKVKETLQLPLPGELREGLQLAVGELLAATIETHMLVLKPKVVVDREQASAQIARHGQCRRARPQSAPAPSGPGGSHGGEKPSVSPSQTCQAPCLIPLALSARGANALLRFARAGAFLLFVSEASLDAAQGGFLPMRDGTASATTIPLHRPSMFLRASVTWRPSCLPCPR